MLRTEINEGRPLRLNTGRIRDQWHTMTRTGMSARLGAHLPEPFVEVHPDDAARYGLADGSFARVTTDHGQCTLKVVVSAAATAWHAVCADPLERSQRIGRARRCAGRAIDRSVLGPAGSQGDAGVDPALRICLSRLRAVAQVLEAARACLVGARHRQRRSGLSHCRQRGPQGLVVVAALGGR